MKKEETFKCLKDTPTGSYKAGEITPNPLCEDFPEYFAKYKFTTKDAVDKYMNDHYFRVFPDGNIWPCIISDCDTNADFSTSFSRLEAAKAYLDEQNKPKFEAGKVYHRKGGGFIFIDHFSEDDKDWAYGYGFDEYGTYSESWGFRISCMLQGETTSEKWVSALIKEAERKYPVGSKINPLWGDLKEWEFNPCYAGTTGFSENKYGNPFYYKGQALMLNGKWASIISEPEKEKTTAEWIRHYKDSDMGLCEFAKKYNLIITKAPSNA